jgi:hypothetical protein
MSDLEDEEFGRMQSVIKAVPNYKAGVDADQRRSMCKSEPNPPHNYVRPEGSLHYCMRSGWREEPDLTVMKRCTPDRWDNVRYRLENYMGLHDTSGKRVTSFLTAQIVNDFESRDLKYFPILKDHEIVDEDAVIIIMRKPSINGINHYVPLDMIVEWAQWFEQKKFSKESKVTRGKRTTFSAQDMDFYTSTHSRGRKGWYRRTQLHASCYSDRPPKYWHCPKCDIAGKHWEIECLATQDELRIQKKNLKLIHGIPKTQLRQVDPESLEGRMATLRDVDDNRYVDLMLISSPTLLVPKGRSVIEYKNSEAPISTRDVARPDSSNGSRKRCRQRSP